MNERIRQLAEETYGGLPISGPGEVYLDTFALKIINECAKFADRETNPIDGYTIGKNMLKHFGVE